MNYLARRGVGSVTRCYEGFPKAMRLVSSLLLPHHFVWFSALRLRL